MQADKLIVCAKENAYTQKARELSQRLGLAITEGPCNMPEEQACILVTEDGLSLQISGMQIRGDLTAMRNRIRRQNLNRELLVRAARTSGKNHDLPFTAVDATAGMGEDALLLAAAGYEVTMYEKDPVIAALLQDTMERAAADPEFSGIMARMRLIQGDSIRAMRQMKPGPDVILLDPMFPERTKSALVRKKFQLLHHLEQPCRDEEELLQAALTARPGKIIIKRPRKGPFLAGRKPSYSLEGKAVRYDCILPGSLPSQ